VAPRPPGLGLRNLSYLRALIATALFLTGMLGLGKFVVLEALQIIDYVHTTRGTAPPGRHPLHRRSFWYAEQAWWNTY
jgi:hypothetical protein